MFSKIQTTFRNPENKQYFMDNEYVYSDTMKEMFEGYNPGEDTATYFAKIFAQFDEMFNKNSKIYSQLKHLSYELAKILSNAGNLIHKISDLYNTSIKDEELTYNRMKFKTMQDVEQINKKLNIGLTEWGSQMITQSRYVIDNLAGFFHYKKHENASFSKLIQVKISNNNNYIKTSADLDSKKQKLFDAKNMDKWKVNHNSLPGDFGEFSKSFEKIKPYMLPDVM